MSRTKCRLSGPVSGTAAGMPKYQPSGPISIQIPLARLIAASAQSTTVQLSVRDIETSFASVRGRPAAAPRAAPQPGTSHVAADDRRQPLDSLDDLRLRHARERQIALRGSLTVEVKRVAPGNRHAFGGGVAEDGRAVDAIRKREPHVVAGRGLGPTGACRHRGAQRLE